MKGPCDLLVLILFLIAIGTVNALAGSTSTSTSKKKSLAFSLQKCTTPTQVLQNVGASLTATDENSHNLASLTLVRLSKQLLTLQNEFLYAHPTGDWNHHVQTEILPMDGTASSTIHHVIQSLVPQSSISLWEPLVEGTKAAAVLARILPELVTRDTCTPLLEFWNSDNNNQKLEPHQLSGLHWAYNCFQYAFDAPQLQLPHHLQQAHRACGFPFFFLPGYLADIPGLTVAHLVQQVPFQVDAIRTTSTRQVVPERRETAWLGDPGVAPFAYSGKSMPRHAWSKLAKSIRDALAKSSAHPVYYDGCLLNHYPDGGSAMRYHSDPDQGQLWDYNTAVVSVGASRRVAFRATPNANTNTNGKQSKENGTSKNLKPPEQPHTFVVMHGDVMVMVDDCQSRFQHTVKPADNKQEQAARASLVFKQTLSRMRH